MTTGGLAPRLSIVIPSHVRADLLTLCLHSVARHAPPGTEVIVVDDASADALISRTAARFDGVRIVRNERPGGFAVAANRGIEAARAPIIELLNDDTQVEANWAGSALARFADPTVAAVAPLVLQGPRTTGPVRIDSAGDEYDPGGFARKRGHGRPAASTAIPAGDVFGAGASSAFYRADVLRRAGAFPESFESYFEDVDLAWRIRSLGYRAVYEPTSRVWHQVGASHRKNRKLIERQSRNEERVYWRNTPNIRGTILRHALVLAGKSIRRWREGCWWPFVFGRIRLLGEIHTLMRHRRVWALPRSTATAILEPTAPTTIQARSTPTTPSVPTAPRS